MNQAVGSLKAEAAQRDAGLPRTIGTGAFAATLVNGVIGGGIFAAPAALAASVGAWAPLALLGCGIVMFAIVLCCAEAGSRVPSSGGIYAFVEAAYGPFWGFVCGFTMWLSCILAAAGVAAAFADALTALVPLGSPGVQRAALVLLAMGTITAVNLRGADLGARFAGLFLAAKLIPLLLFVGLGAFFIEPDRLAPAAAVDPAAFGSAMILALFAFSGVETVLAASGEVARPERTVPRALLIAMTAVLVIYVAVQVVAQGLLGPALGNAPEPLAQAIGGIDARLVPVIAIGAALSRGGWLFSDALGAPRMPFAFARDGFLPSCLGAVNAAGAPGRAIVLHIGIATLLALGGEFGPLVLLSGLFTVPIYIGACLAALALRRRDTALAGQPFRVPGLVPAGLIGVAAMIALILLAGRTEQAGLLAAIFLSAGLYWLRRRRLRV